MKQSILITGCSSGIGLCAAKMLHEHGYRVFASARKMADVASLKSLGLTALQLDITDPVSIQRALDDILKQTGGTLDAIFNNAGIAVPGAVEDLTQEMIHKQFLTNVYGPIELIRRVLPIMRQQGHGRIIQNSSILGVVTLPYTGAYSASKFALEAFSNALYQELRGTNIFVSCIDPGPIESSLRQHSFESYQETDFSRSAHREVYKKLEKEYFQRSDREKSYLKGPETVVKKLIVVLESRRPGMHYYVGVIARVFAILRRILPDSVMAWVTSKAR